MKPFAASFALNSSRGNGDGFASWVLSGENWLGTVADAPTSASPGSVNLLFRIVGDWVESRGRENLSAFTDAGGGAELLTGLLAHTHDLLLRKGDSHWAAAVFVLVGRDSVFLAGRGDCAAYLRLVGGTIFRYSDTTSIEGGGILPAFPDSATTNILHHEEGVYLGAGENVLRARDCISFRRDSVCRLLLVSDGLEDCLGVAEIVRLLSEPKEDFDERSFSAAVQEKELKDDTTFLGLALSPGTETPGAGAKEATVPKDGTARIPGDASDSIGEAEGGYTSDPRPETVSGRGATMARRLLGFSLSFLSLLLVAGLLWFMIRLYLEEAREEMTPLEKNIEILSSEPENPE